MATQEPQLTRIAWRHFGLPASLLGLDRPGEWFVSIVMNQHAGTGLVLARPGEEAGAIEIVQPIAPGKRFRWHALHDYAELMQKAEEMGAGGFYHSFRRDGGGWKYNFASITLMKPT